MERTDDEPVFWSLDDVARILKTTRQTVFTYVNQGKLKTTRFGRRVLFNKVDFLNDIARLSKYEYDSLSHKNDQAIRSSQEI